MLRVWKNRKIRNTFLQLAYIIILLALLGSFVVFGWANIQARNMASGFGFLEQPTGWQIGFSLLNYNSGDPYWLALLVGFLNTLFLCAIGLSLATVIGIFIGVLRVSSSALARLVGVIYVDVFRSVPAIVQALFWYTFFTHLPGPHDALNFADIAFFSSRGIYLPVLNVTMLSTGIAFVILVTMIVILVWIIRAKRFRRMEPFNKSHLRLLVLGVGLVCTAFTMWLGRIPNTPLVSVPTLKGFSFSGGLHFAPELLAMLVSLTLFGGAYIGEIVRGGFDSVGKGQIEAASSVGLTPFQTLTRIQFPLAFRAMLPMLTNRYAWLVKATTIGVAVGFPELYMIVSGSINHTGNTFELIAILMAAFLVINLTLVTVLSRLNSAIAIKGY